VYWPPAPLNGELSHKASEAAFIGDLMWWDESGGCVRPAAEFPNVSEDADQLAFAVLFCGVSNSAQLASDAVGRRARLLIDGIWEFPCAAATYAVGDYVTPDYSGGLLSQRLKKTDDNLKAIGRVVAEYGDETTKIKVRLHSRLLTGNLHAAFDEDDIVCDSITGGDSSLGITGKAGSSGAGGAVPITGGAGDSGAGGAVSLTGGAGNGANAGGASTVTGGVGGSGGSGGNASLTGGAGTGAGAAGTAILRGGAGGATNVAGGTASVIGGAGGGTGNGGAVAVTGGASGAGATGAGGAVAVAGGAAASTNGNGGAVTIDGGAKAGSGTNGAVSIGTVRATTVTIGMTAGRLFLMNLPTSDPTAAGQVYLDNGALMVSTGD
jgi:hypothetical protein